MIQRYFRAVVALLVVVLSGALPPTQESVAEPVIRVATTLPTFASLVEEVGGSRVEVSAVASPRFNPHFIEPRPSDVLRVKRAALFVHGGLDLEAWREPLLDAVARSEFRAGGDKQLDLSVGIPLIQPPAAQLTRRQGDIHLLGNPHFWTDPEMGVIMVRAIAAKLAQIAPQYATEFSDRESAFVARLSADIGRWREGAKRYKGSKLVGYHDEWAYLMRFLGLTMEQFLEPKPGIPPTPQRLESLREYIRAEKVKAIAQSSYFSTDPAKSIAAATGVPILLLCQSVGELPSCGDYRSMVQHNIDSILKVLSE